MNQLKQITILLADDDEDDRMMTRDAFARHGLAESLQTVGDGVELLAYLRQQGPYAKAPRPHVILLDLNMPRMDGREALREIKSDPQLRAIPVVVLTTSSEEEDVAKTYDLGANSFMTKPVGLEALVKVLGSFDQYWFGAVELPAAAGGRSRG